MDIEILPIEKENMKSKDILKDPDSLGFGNYFTDRMFVVKWTEDKGWHDAKIKKYEDFVFDPATLVLHYGQEIFEGLKAFRSKNGDILLFRPWENVKRMNRSAERMSMPTMKEEDMLEAIVELVKLEKDWVPDKRGASLYIRPTMIATEKGLGVRPSKEYIFFIILSPSGPYFKEGFKPITLLATDKYVRAVPGGVGEAKTGGNYAASLKAKKLAKNYGCAEVLWLDAYNKKFIEEVGAMNIAFVINDVITTPRLDGSILHGITRKSVLEMGKKLGFKVSEREISIHEIMEGAQNGSVTECFGLGTAASIAPVGEIKYLHYEETGENITSVKFGDKPGKIAERLYKELQDIQYGEKEPPFEGWILKIE